MAAMRNWSSSQERMTCKLWLIAELARPGGETLQQLLF
jgi:hypothetical protein